MIDYIKGEITELTPAYVVIETGGIGYFINIALPVFSLLSGKNSAKLYIYEVIREDAYLLYGFSTKDERQLFLLLISVSGIGANTARMVMSSYSVEELQGIIASENDSALSSIKGIGTKTAQRIIVDLKDKILKITSNKENLPAFKDTTSQIKEEAIAALVMLGFSAAVSQKAIDSILKKQSVANVEDLIKQVLKII
ncbi:MAG: Holliday junction branch migration protein RuvA [Paludibacteraceae bacterium]|nr:Holliday junction branch migration protein RuvA [Paludibacteraceae bacterium]